MWVSLSDPAAPAWVQAIGSILAILIALVVPEWQRRRALQDAATDRGRQAKEHLCRLTVALRAEIGAASEAAGRREAVITSVLSNVQQALRAGASVKETGPIHPGSLSLTDATIYKKIASEIGRFPSGVIKAVVDFYSGALEIERVADGAATALHAYEAVLPLLPRFKVYAAIVVRTLEKFEASDFATDGDVRPTPSEIRQFAAAAGYPLDQIAKERGITLPA